ncbi:MAG: hypothetical protein H6765_00245 [Candidatus Peribacteria bacterium]|nr:MAG: hypothetical protein H6765_00245 [Candidatus Peribacteria bacterium]
MVNGLNAALSAIVAKNAVNIKKHRCKSRASWGLLDGRNREVAHLEWDSLHGEFEVYDLAGNHLGSIPLGADLVVSNNLGKSISSRRKSCECN